MLPNNQTDFSYIMVIVGIYSPNAIFGKESSENTLSYERVLLRQAIIAWLLFRILKIKKKILGNYRKYRIYSKFFTSFLQKYFIL